MKTVKVVDMTLRELDTVRGNALTFKEKLEVARALDRLKVDVVELAPIGESKAEQLANRTIAGIITQTISAAVDAAAGNVDETWESIKSAVRPQLNIVAPVSTVQMEYACNMKAPAMAAAIEEQVKKARFHCEQVEFSAVDATRAEMDFLCAVIDKAIAAGAGKITLCDTAGIMMPDEFAAFVREVMDNVPAIKNVELYVQVSDAMSMGIACAAAAVAQGAAGIKCTAVPAGMPTLEQFTRFVEVKGPGMGIQSGIRKTELNRTVSQLKWILQPKEEEGTRGMVTADAAASNVVLDSNDDISEVIKVIRQLGYDLSDEDNVKVYEAFRRVADKKHFVGTRELDSIVASTALQVPSTYRIENYVINSGNVITATANILLEKNGEKIRGVGVGDGPIDAAFLAIEQIIGHRYELDDFQIQTVTEGRDAMGSALVKLRADGRVYSGTGISTDIIGASIRAYISALNKIVYEEA